MARHGLRAGRPDDADRAGAALRRADRVCVGFDRLFRGTVPTAAASLPLALYLQGTTSAREIPAPNSAELALCLASADDLALAVVRALVSRRFGAGGVQASPIVEGLAGLLDAPTSLQATAARANAWVRTELASLRPVSPLTGAPSGIPAPDHAAASFVAFLRDEFEPAALARYLATYDPEWTDLAAATAYQQPLAALEAAWIIALSRSNPRGSVSRAFVRFLLPWLRPYRWRLVEMLV